MFPAVHAVTHRGIPVRWADLPGPLTGTLIFGVGQRDEPAHLMGVTHLIEHLVFRAIEPVQLEHVGVVTDEALTFHATGEPDAVATFLNDVCLALRAVGDVSEADLALEKSVICVEACSNEPTAGLLTYRFGLGSLGNANASHPGGHDLTAAEVAAWSSSWLTSDNAALTFTGPVPAALDLQLRPGNPPQRWSGHPVVATPRLVASGKSGVAISMITEASAAFELGMALRQEAHNLLRHGLGLIYSPDVFHTRINEHDVQLDLILDPDDEHVPRVVEESLALLRRLAAGGFSESTVAATRSGWLTALDWTNSVVGQQLDDDAVAELLGVSSSTPELDRARAESVTGERLTAALIVALPSLILAYDDGVSLDEKWVEVSGLEDDRYEAWESDLEPASRRGRRWRGRRRGDASGLRAALHDGVLSTESKAGTGSIRLRELAVVGQRGCGCLDLVDARGRDASVDPDDWYRGKSMIPAILAEIRPEIVRAFPSH